VSLTRHDEGLSEFGNVNRSDVGLYATGFRTLGAVVVLGGCGGGGRDEKKGKEGLQFELRAFFSFPKRADGD
jgi:hypothetical protein